MVTRTHVRRVCLRSNWQVLFQIFNYWILHLGHARKGASANSNSTGGETQTLPSSDLLLRHTAALPIALQASSCSPRPWRDLFWNSLGAGRPALFFSPSHPRSRSRRGRNSCSRLPATTPSVLFCRGPSEQVGAGSAPARSASLHQEKRASPED